MAIPSASHNVSGWASVFAVRLKPELRELYAFSLFFAFAYALITIFEPVFFYKEGFSLSFIALYYAVHYSVYVFALPLGGKFAARFGLERSLIISLPAFVAYFITLAAVSEYKDLVWLAIVFLTIHKIFYWPAFHTLFAKHGEAGNRGTELSWMRVLQYGVGILGPVVGGVIARFFGFPILFIFTACLVMLAAIPLLRTKERFRVSSFPYRLPWDMIISPKFRNMSRAMLGMGENLIDMVFWPVFLFIILGNEARLGIISSIAVGLMTITSFFVGEVADKVSRRYLLRLHLPFLVLSYLFRPFAVTPVQALLTEGFSRMSFSGVNLAMLYRLYTQGKSTRVLGYVIAFEMVLAFAKALTAISLIFVFGYFLPYDAFSITFVAAAVMALMYIFL